MENSNYLRYKWTTIWLTSGTVMGLGFIIWFALADGVNAGNLLSADTL